MSIQIWEFSEIKCSSIKLLSNAWFPVTVVPSALCTLSSGMRWWGTSNYTVDYTGNYKTFSFSGGINITRLKAEKFAFLFQKVCYWLPSNKVWCVSSIPQLVLHIADMCIHGKFQTSKKKIISCDLLIAYCSWPGSSVHRILQARIQKWFASSSSKGSSQPRDRTWVSCIAARLFYHLCYQGSP